MYRAKETYVQLNQSFNVSSNMSCLYKFVWYFNY